jgi:NAD(P)-dependent dehydrogenase (short-subunit alcohol dehydrogenase family)
VIDVTAFDEVAALKTQVFETFGEVGLLMNNAGVAGGGQAYDNLDGWRRVLEVNLFGVLNGVQAFVPARNRGSPRRRATPPTTSARRA